MFYNIHLLSTLYIFYVESNFAWNMQFFSFQPNYYRMFLLKKKYYVVKIDKIVNYIKSVLEVFSNKFHGWKIRRKSMLWRVIKKTNFIINNITFHRGLILLFHTTKLYSFHEMITWYTEPYYTLLHRFYNEINFKLK